MAIEAITGILDCFIAMFFSWRFVFSKSYRTRKLKEWSGDRWSAAFEILFGLFGIALTIGIVIFAYFVLLR